MHEGLSKRTEGLSSQTQTHMQALTPIYYSLMMCFLAAAPLKTIFNPSK